MNKVEFAVCRIRQILPKNEGSLTRGSGCVVKCEWFSSERGWKCPYILVTSSNVLHRDELTPGKAFVADFLLKDKKGLETFDLNLAADACMDIPGRAVWDDTDVKDDGLAKEQSMTIISVEKLDKRGFLRRMAKKSSLQTTRPLVCFDTAKLNAELSEGLYCHVIREEESQEFSTRTYKFLFLAETRQFVLQDFGNTEIKTIRGFPNEEMPLGAVIYTKRGEFAGLLEFAEERIEPYFFSVEIRLSAAEVTTTNGEQATDQGLSNNNASTAWAGAEQADNPDKDSEKDSLDEALNEEAGKNMKHTEDSCEKAVMAGNLSEKIAAVEDQMPLDTSTGTTSAEAAPSTIDLNDDTASLMQQDDNTVLVGVPVLQSSVVVEDRDKIVVEVHTKSEDIAGSSSEQNSCNSLDDQSPKCEDQTVAVDETRLDEIVTSAGGAEDSLRNEENAACELLENTREDQTSVSFVNEGMSVSEDTTLINAEGAQAEPGLVGESKADEQNGASEELFGSTAASEELQPSSIQRTLSDELHSSQAAKLNIGKQGDNESATALVQTSADSDTEVSRDLESGKTVHENLSNEKQVSVNSGTEQGEEVTNVPGVGAVMDKVVDDKADTTCIPDTQIVETPSDTLNLDKDMEEILSTTSDEEGVRSPDSSHEEPSERLAHMESGEQELNVGKVAEKVEEQGDTENDGEEDNEKFQEEKEGDREMKSVETTEGKERLEQSEIYPSTVVQDNEGRESEEGPTPKQDQEEDIVRTETGEDGETAVTDNEEAEREEESAPEQDKKEDEVTTATGQEGETVVTDKEEKDGEDESAPEQDQKEEDEVTTATGEGEDGETVVTETTEKEVKEKEGKGEEVDKRECKVSEEIQRQEQGQDKEEEMTAETTNGEDAAVAISREAEEQSGEKDNEMDQKIEGHEQEEKDEGGQCVQVQDRPENDTGEEEELVKGHIQGEEEKEEGETEKVQSQQKEEVHNHVEKHKGEVEEMLKDEEIHVEVDGDDDYDPRERTKQAPLMNQEQVEEEVDDLSDSVVQRIDADSLLSETITDNSRILDELAKCLDTDYQYSLLPSWRDLADLLAIPPEAYEHYDVYSVSSPTEDLFVFLSSTKPDMTMKEIREALVEIGRPDVVQIMDKFRMRNLISDESVVASLVEQEDRDLLGKLALKLDRGSPVIWKHLAQQLDIPRRVYKNFGSNQGYNSALLLLKYLPIFAPELTIADLKEVLERILRKDVISVLGSAGIPDDEHVRDILDDAELMDQITDLLNDDEPNWRELAKELKVPPEKCQLFEPTEDERSSTKLLFKSLQKSEPDITVEELILALVAMKRQDVLDVLATYLNGDDIDLILEENNLLLDESHDLSEGDTAN